MKIVIAHLYYDLMNLYGESGNIKILKNALEELGIKVDIHFASVGDEMDFKNYDFIYIGSGTERNELIALNDIKKRKKDIENAINDNKFFLLTGNSYELLGNSLINNNKTYKCLNFFNFDTIHQEKRTIGNVVCKSKLFKSEIIGFYNMQGTNNYDGFLDTSFGTREGIKYKNLLGTYLVGPILVKNPHLLKYLINEIIKSKEFKIKKKYDNYFEMKAYNNFIDEYVKSSN